MSWLTGIFGRVRYTSAMVLDAPDTHRATPQPSQGATPMLTKLAITVVAALSILASPVFAGPINHSQTGSVYDFQLDGR